MVKSKDDSKTKQFRWSVPMSHLMLEILAEEAELGNKPSNTFKYSSFVRVAEAINGKFEAQCEPKHVDNHLRTIKNTWNIIMKLRDGKSGFGWDDNLKMITCSKDNYDKEISAHPSHEKFLNKKIEMYKEMALVVGKDMATGCFHNEIALVVDKDMATGCFPKSFTDIGMNGRTEVDSAADVGENDLEEVTKSKQASSSGSSSKSRSHRKRSREEAYSTFDQIAGQLGEIASAIKKFSDNQVNTEDLYKEVMKMDGYDEGFLGAAFDQLNSNNSLARGFMVKSYNLRRLWMEKFMNESKTN